MCAECLRVRLCTWVSSVDRRGLRIPAVLLKNQLVVNDMAARIWTWVFSRAPWVLKDWLSLQLLLFFHLERGNLNVLVTWMKSLKCRFSWQQWKMHYTFAQPGISAIEMDLLSPALTISQLAKQIRIPTKYIPHLSSGTFSC